MWRIRYALLGSFCRRWTRLCISPTFELIRTEQEINFSIPVLFSSLYRSPHVTYQMWRIIKKRSNETENLGRALLLLMAPWDGNEKRFLFFQNERGLGIRNMDKVETMNFTKLSRVDPVKDACLLYDCYWAYEVGYWLQWVKSCHGLNPSSLDINFLYH